MIFILKIIVALILLGFAYAPFREAASYRFRGQSRLVAEAAFYAICALIVLWIPSYFFFLVLLIGGGFFYYNYSKRH